MVFTSVKSQNRKIGLWIDLTNTCRHDKEILRRAECEYVKLNCKGHDETADPKTVNTFIDLCYRFIQTNPTDIIGDHCTHGFNRTGHLIVSYLVQRLDWSVEAVVREFAQVRPPGIYKKDYLVELFQLCNFLCNFFVNDFVQFCSLSYTFTCQSILLSTF
jgi:mRNA-capping enzyme